MVRKKNVRGRGKIGLSRLFVGVNVGDKVALVRNLSFTRDFPERFQGKTGTVIGERGSSRLVRIYDGKRQKTLIVKRINLKKLSN